MTAEELIKKLERMPKDKQVVFWIDDKDWFQVNSVFTDSDGDIGLME